MSDDVFFTYQGAQQHVSKGRNYIEEGPELLSVFFQS
jgi:hypothetical protein